MTLQNNKGVLIAIEGISGAGKTFFSKKLKSEIEKTRDSCILIGGFETFEYSSKLTKLINEFSKETLFIGLPWLSETHLIFAEFLHEVENLVIPELEKGKVVIYDSYIDSIRAFQATRANNNPNKEFYLSHLSIIINHLKGLIPLPNLSVYLNCDIKTSIKRVELRNQTILSNLQIKTLKKLKKVYEMEVITDKYLIINNYNDSAKVLSKQLKNTAKIINKSL